MLDPQDYRDVLLIARARSLKGAAVASSVDPSTMGRRLDSIEARFGARLFLRSARGFEPTPDAIEVIALAEKMDALRIEFERALLARRAQGPNSLTITSAEWGAPMLTPIVAELAKAHPETQLVLRIENRTLDLTRREADIALRIGKPAEDTLAGRRVGVVAYGLYASVDYLAQHPAPRDIGEASRHLFCSLGDDLARTPHVRWQAAIARDARVVVRTNSMLALLEAVRIGAGLATLPCSLAERSPELRRVLPELASVERDLWIVFHRDLRASRGVRKIVDALVARVKPLFAPVPRPAGAPSSQRA